MGKTHALKKSAKKFITKWAKDAQVDHLKTNLGQALVLSSQTQEEERRLRETLDQRWWEFFAEKDSEVKIVGEPENAELDEVSRRVVRAWNQFQNSLPKEARADLRDKPPDLRFLQDAVVSANKNLNQRKQNSPTKARFEKVCKAFDDYQNLGGVIPSGDKYICLVTGSLSALIKASVNHADVADGVSQALVDICEDISYWGRLVKQHPVNGKIQTYIRELYAEMFECFADIFAQWQRSSWTRIAKSFNRNLLFEIVERHRNVMRKVTEYLEREVRLEQYQYMSDVSRYTSDTVGEIARLHSRFDNFEDIASQGFFVTFEQQNLLVTGVNAQHTLTDNYATRQLDLMPVDSTNNSIQSVPQIEEWKDESAASTGSVHTKLSPQLSVQSAGFSLSEAAPPMHLISASDLSIQPETSENLRKWTSSISSTFFWIEDFDLSAARFAFLDGTEDSVVSAISVLRDLLIVFPGNLVCFVDGLQYLTYGKAQTKPLVQKLIETLCSKSPKSNGVRKVLFTTDGYLEVLAKSVQSFGLSRVTYDTEAEDDDSTLSQL